MVELIYKQVVIDTINELHEKPNAWLDCAVEAVKALPPVQQEQKTALWIIRKWGDDARCSNCGRYFKDVYDMDNYDNFCRHCGSNMKGLTIGKVD